MAQCYHQLCDHSELNDTIPFAKAQFHKLVAQSALNAVIDSISCPNVGLKSFRDDPSCFNDGTYILYNKIFDRPMVGIDPFKPSELLFTLNLLEVTPVDYYFSVPKEEVRTDVEPRVNKHPKLLIKTDDAKSARPSKEPVRKYDLKTRYIKDSDPKSQRPSQHKLVNYSIGQSPPVVYFRPPIYAPYWGYYRNYYYYY